MLAEQARRPIALGLREHELRARLCKLRRALVALRLVRTRVDDEQHVALLYLTALGEVDRGDVTGDARTDLDALHGLEAAGELIEFRDLARDHLRHVHLRRWRRRLDSAASLRAQPLRLSDRDEAAINRR